MNSTTSTTDSDSNTLPPALEAERCQVNGHAGPLSYYRSAPEQSVAAKPLLLLHSINAAAGAHEIRPLFEYYRQTRAVYAPDLPGYGFSDRSARHYSPRLMTDAVHDMISEIRQERGDPDLAVDALAVSLSCEFLARAATESPSSFNSLALVSPTGFNRREFQDGPSGTNRGIPWLYRVLTLPLLGQSLFRLLARPASIRFFLRKTWGSKQIDEGMYEYACLTVREPGASRAPFRFLSGYLFSADLAKLYPALSQSVWMAHGNRGDFTDYRLKSRFESDSRWQINEFDSGALPYFENPTGFFDAYDRFLAETD